MASNIDELKNRGLLTDEQLDQLSVEERQVLEELTEDELKALEDIEQKVRSAGATKPLRTGNIIF